MSYSLSISDRLRAFEGVTYQIIVIKIKKKGGKFSQFSLEPFVSVINGTTTVKSFLTGLSGDEKEIVGCFTSDAFVSFSGLSQVIFGYGRAPMDSFDNVDIVAVKVPLDPMLASLNAPLGDTTWLNS